MMVTMLTPSGANSRRMVSETMVIRALDEEFEALGHGKISVVAEVLEGMRVRPRQARQPTVGQ
jgi:hypothetical protein